MDNHQKANPYCTKCKGKLVHGGTSNVKQDKDYQELMHDNKLVMNEIHKLKRQVENLKSGYTTLTNGLTKYADMMSSTTMKYDKQGLGFYTKKVEQAKNKVKAPPKPKVKYCTECQQEGHFAHDCKTPPPTMLIVRLHVIVVPRPPPSQVDSPC
jgi:RNase P subunit RPR2